MSAEDDARKRYEDWIAGGGHDYNAEAAAKEQGQSNPYIVSDAAKGAIQAPPPAAISAPAPSAPGPTLVDAGSGPTNEYGIPISGRTWTPVTTTSQANPVTTQGAPPTVTQSQTQYTQVTPRTTQGQVTTGQPSSSISAPVPGSAAPTGKRTVITDTGPIEVSDADYARVANELAQRAAEIKRQQEFENQLKSQDSARAERQIKISEMLAAADKAYKEALIQGATADRAQKAAEAAMQANLQQQLIDIQRMFQGAQIAIQQRQAREQSLQRRPFTRPTPVRIQ